MSYEWVGFGLVCGLVAGIGAWVWARPWSHAVRSVVLWGLALRVGGCLMRYEVLFRLYGGVGDATGYFGYGRAYATAIWAGDFSIFSADHWFAGRWWGTQFVRYAAAAVLSIVGPSMRGGFLFFSLLSFIGLGLFAVAFHRVYPHVPLERYLAWLFLFPSLWFWPSSIGKDALLILGMGLVVVGYVGRRGSIQWTPLLLGLVLSAAIRPHVTMAMIMVTALAQWLTPVRQLSVGRIVQSILIAVVALIVVQRALGQLGLDPGDLEGIQEFATVRSGLTDVGGSQVGTPGGPLAIPFAFVNVLFRPFLFEVHNVPTLVSALELVVFWLLVLHRRRRVWLIMKAWRHDRMLRLAVLISAAYALMLGLVMGNLGIIARQRILILPFLFLTLEAYPVHLYVRARRAQRAKELYLEQVQREQMVGGGSA